MKASIYNFFFQYDNNPNKLLAYNSRTNALAIIEETKYQKYKGYVNEGQLIDDKELLEDLKKGGFLVDSNVNELDILRFNMLSSRYASKNLGLTIAPTLDCNFACVYCYEKGKTSGCMAEEVQNKVIEFIEYQARYFDTIGVVWYGGEPLLAIDIIENMTQKILNICNEKKVKYSATIITNGYNLTREIVNKFKRLNIHAMQITIDGTQETHDARRMLKNGESTFAKILQNLTVCKEQLPKTQLRVNIDKENSGCLDELIKVIQAHGLEEVVSLYLGYIEPTNDCYSKSKCLKYNKFAKLDYDFNRILHKNKFGTGEKYPMLKTNVCTADDVNSMVIDPDGYIYKCWSDIGIKEYRINNLFENKVSNTKKFLDYLLYDPTVDKQCSKCKFLPLCMGGCPRRRIDAPDDRCVSYKYVLKNYLQDFAENKG